MSEQEEIKEKIIASAQDFVADFMYYDRKNDEELSVDQIEEAFKSGLVTVDEILNVIRSEFKGNGYE